MPYAAWCQIRCVLKAGLAGPEQKAGVRAMSVFAEVLQYRPFRRMFPSAGAGCILSDSSFGSRAARRGSAFILMPWAALSAAMRTAQAHF
jgi:hypothetical protein